MGVLDQLAGGSARPENRPKAAPVSPPVNPVKRDARGRLMPGSANLNPGGRKKGLEAELREMLARAGGDALIEGVIAGQVVLPSGEVQEVRDLRLRVETFRWAYERANGKALERSANVNLDMVGGEAALQLDRLPIDVLDGLLTASQVAPALPPGTVEGELVPDLPGTDSNTTNASEPE